MGLEPQLGTLPLHQPDLCYLTFRLDFQFQENLNFYEKEGKKGVFNEQSLFIRDLFN